MEHLPRPASATSKEPETISCVCQKEYDGGSCLTYPIGQGKSYILPAASNTVGNLPFWQCEKHYPSSKQELESFFQTWLFFGFIHEILGEIGSANDFVRTPSDGTSKVVTTPKLLSTIDEWVQKS